MEIVNQFLITGGSGFLGYHLSKALISNLHSVRCLDRYKPSWIDESNMEFIEGDFAATHHISAAIADCDVIFHLACTTLPETSNEDPDFDVSSNVLGTIRMLDEAVKAKVKKVIFISSGGTVYGIPSIFPTHETHPTNPTCSYGITKLTIEKYLSLYSRIHGLKTCSIRLANPYGEYQRVDSIQGAIAVFCHKAITNQPIQIWGDGTVRRDFIYISDAIDAILKIMNSPISNCEINIGSGRAESLNGIIDVIEQITGKKIQKIFESARNFDVPVSFLDISKAKSVLGWEPTINIYDGLKITLDWMHKFYLKK